jgi:hypothetical protein
MAVTSTRLAAEEWRADDNFVPLTFEKVVGLNNLLRIAWLSRGLEVAAAVCRLVTPTGPASGFLVANDVLLTNNHVLPDARTAAGTTIEFNYQVNWAGDLEPVRRYALDASYFRTNEELDYSLVRVKENPGELFGYVDLSQRGEATVNDYVTVIQHPNGGTKQICFTDNKVSAVFGNVLQYATDTEPGSSGSPVFNQQWQIVGLHHRGGGLAGPDGKKYFTNQGIAISDVFRDAGTFLGLSDSLYDLAFSDLRSELVGLVDETHPPSDADAVATELLRTMPRFGPALDDWSELNGSPGASGALTLAGAGIAIGGALRQWARSTGHESIKAVAVPDTAPSDALVALVSPFNGTDALPSDVYAAILTGVRADAALAEPVAAATGGNGLAAAARAFVRGVETGASAYGPVRARQPSDPPPAGPAPSAVA